MIFTFPAIPLQYQCIIYAILLVQFLCIFRKDVLIFFNWWGRVLSDNGVPSSSRVGGMSIVATFNYDCVVHYNNIDWTILAFQSFNIFVLWGFAKITDAGMLMDKLALLKSGVTSTAKNAVPDNKVAVIALLFGSILFATGCNTDKKLYRQAEKFHFNHVDMCDSLAGKWYPVQTKTVEHIKEIPGVPTVEISTEYVHDTQVVGSFIYIHDTAKIIKNNTRVDTIRITDSIQLENTAKLDYANDRISKISSQLEISKCREHNYFWWAIITSGIIALLVAFAIFKPRW